MKGQMFFKVKTDEDFFDRFQKLAEDIKNLGSMFQNPDTVSNSDEFLDWMRSSFEFQKECEELIKESVGRIIQIEEGEN